MSIRILMNSLMIIGWLILFFSNTSSFPLLFLLVMIVNIGLLIGEIRFQRYWKSKQREIQEQEKTR